MKKYLFFLLLLFFISSLKAQTDSKSNSGTNALLNVGTISVTIGGDFLITGSFPALINERVDDFVTRMFNEGRAKLIGNINDPTIIDKINKKLDEYSLRNITLKRADGEVLHLDLLKFRLTGDFSDNPYLMNDDVLIFAPADLQTNFFTISGAVNYPGKFPFVQGDKLSDAIELAQGINKSYENVTHADIFRLSYNGEKMQKIKVNLDSTFLLERGDRIIVAADESQRKAFSVLVLGEVNRPGQIPITKSNTTIREALREAGGFTNDASLSRAKLIRGTNLQFILEKEFGLNLEKESQYLNQYPNPIVFQYEKEKMLGMSTLTEQDTVFFDIDETLRQMLNESSFDFDNVMDDSSGIGNEKLRNGDIIIIPQKVNTVYVYGQVANPGNIKFVEGKDYSYYIKEAGGLGSLAKSGEIAVIKGVSREWIPVDKSPKIDPGDYIYVPKNPVRTFDYYVGRVANYLSIVASVATIILLLTQLKKL